MTFVEALTQNVDRLATKAVELRQRIAFLQSNKRSAEAPIKELVASCDEIGRLNQAILEELRRQSH